MPKKEDFKTFNNIHASARLKENILNNTIKKNDEKHTLKNKIPRFAFVLIIAISITLISCGALANNLIQKYIVKEKEIYDGAWIDQFIEINNGVNITDNTNLTCDDINSLKDMEEKLNIEFAFDTDEYNNEISICDIKHNENGEIENVYAYVYLFYDFPEYNKKIDENYLDNLMNENVLERNIELKTLGLEIRFMSDKASKGTKEEFANIEVTGRKYDNDRHEFFLSNINTYGFYITSPTRYIQFSKEFYFVNNNILYRFLGNHPTNVDEILKILESF